MNMAFMYRKEMYFIPVVMILKVRLSILSSLSSIVSSVQMLANDNTSDREIHACLMRGAYKNNSAFDK